MSASDSLAVLMDAGLIVPAEDFHSQAFTFQHALLQDAAYASLLRSERRTLHRAVGETLEAEFQAAANPLELAPRLGEHFQEAGDLARAQAYFLRAGDAAALHYANAEAIVHFRRALAMADPSAADPASLQHMLLNLGQALELSGRHAEAMAAYEQLEQIGQDRRAPAVRHAAVMARAKIYATLTPEHDAAQAERLLELALAEVRSRGDEVEESKVLWNLMVLRMWSGEDFLGAIELGQQAAALARRARSAERLAFALNDLAYPYVATGQLTAARTVVAEAQTLWRDLHNTPMLVDNLSQSVQLRYHVADFLAGEAEAQEAIHLSEEIGNLWGRTNSRLYYGLILMERGEIGRAIETMRAAVGLGDLSRHPGALVGARTDLALLLADLGALDEASQLVGQAEAIAGEIGANARAYPAAARARLAMRLPDLGEARRAITSARAFLRPAGLQWFAPLLVPLIEAEMEAADGAPASARSRLTELAQFADSLPARPFVPEILRRLAMMSRGLGELDQARQELLRARQLAQANGLRWRLFPILVDLADVLRRTGDRSGSREVVREARVLLDAILPMIPEGSLRDSFRGRPDVRATLAT